MLTHTNRWLLRLRYGALVITASLATQLVAARTARAQEVILSVPYFEQLTGVWCSMAAAEMILAYYGSSVQQCEEANLDLSRSDCCNSPTPTACTSFSSEFTGTPLAYYGVSWTEYPNNSFSFAQFQTELNAGRPVSVGWSWQPGPGGHAMNIVGYYTSGSWLFMLDPGAGTACGGGEESCWMTYAQYLGGTGYNHVAQGPLYNVANAPICPSDYFDIPYSQTQQCYDTWTHRALYPVALTSTASGSNVLYSGSFQAQTGVGWGQTAGQSLSAYDASWTSYESIGYRPSQVSVTSGVYSALWTPAEGAYSSYTGMSTATLNSTHASLAGMGYSMVDLFASDGPTYAAVWVLNAANGQFYDTGLTSAQYSSKFSAEEAVGVRPARISAWVSGGTTYYAVLWQNNSTGAGYGSYVAESESSFVSTNSSMVTGGYHLKYVSARANVFSGIWTP